MRRSVSFILEDMNHLLRNHVSLSVCTSLALVTPGIRLQCLFKVSFSVLVLSEQACDSYDFYHILRFFNETGYA